MVSGVLSFRLTYTNQKRSFAIVRKLERGKAIENWLSNTKVVTIEGELIYSSSSSLLFLHVFYPYSPHTSGAIQKSNANSTCTFFGVRTTLSRRSAKVSDFFDPGDSNPLLKVQNNKPISIFLRGLYLI